MANFDKDSESFVKCILYQFEIIWKTLSKCFDVYIHGFSGLDIFGASPLIYGWLNTHFYGEPGYIGTAHCFRFGINSEICHWVWVFYINFSCNLLWCHSFMMSKGMKYVKIENLHIHTKIQSVAKHPISIPDICHGQHRQSTMSM